MGKRNTQTPNNNTKPESRSNTIERKNSRREKNLLRRQTECVPTRYIDNIAIWCCGSFSLMSFILCKWRVFRRNFEIQLKHTHLWKSYFFFYVLFLFRIRSLCLLLFASFFFHIIQLVKNRIPFKNLCCIRFPHIYWTFKVNKNTDEFFECSITIIIWFERTAKSTTNDGPNTTKIIQQKSLTNHSINIHDVLIVRLWEIQQKKIYFNVFVLSNASLNVIQMEWMKIGEWRLSDLSQKWFWNKKHSFFPFVSIFDLFFVYTFFCTTWIISRSGMGKKLFTNM